MHLQVVDHYRSFEDFLSHNSLHLSFEIVDEENFYVKYLPK